MTYEDEESVLARDHVVALETLVEDLDEIIDGYLRQIRMGYTLDVTLQDVLEEMERTIR